MSAKLTVAMIVKDEAAVLPRFLECLGDVADELLVVDTGSTDATVALLTAAGARVLHRPWDGDFSAARNFGLQHATGDWVLVLDADELVRPALKVQLRALMADDAGAGAATVVMHNPLPHGHQRQSRLLRLFRNGPHLRFRYRIHEDISEAVQGALTARGERLVHLSGGVDHLGYVREHALGKDKKARDLALLDRCLAEDPKDLYSHFKRLELARFWADEPLLRALAPQAQDALDAAPPEVLARAPYAGELAALLADALHPGAPKDGEALLTRLSTRLLPSAALFLRRGELREAQGEMTGAAADFDRCQALAPALGNLQLSTVRPLLGHARLAFARGALGAAQGFVTDALAYNPLDPEALLLAATLARAGGAAGLQTFYAAHARAHGDAHELRAAAAEAALRAGDFDWAAEVASPPAGEASLLCLAAQAFLGQGDLARARDASERALAHAPEAGLGVLLCDLAQGQDSDLTLELEPERAAQLLRRWLEPVRRGRSAPLRASICALAPALKDAFPWLPAHVAAWV